MPPRKKTKRSPPIYEEITGTVWGIYLVTCLVNNREYVGCSDDIKRRWEKEHFRWPFSKMKRKMNRVRLLYADIRKHKLHNFQFNIIYRCKPEQQTQKALWDLEKFFVFQRGTYNPAEANPRGGYNLTRGGSGTLGAKHAPRSKVSRAKQSATMKGRKNPAVAASNIARTGNENLKYWLGKKQSKEHIAKRVAKTLTQYRARLRGTNDEWIYQKGTLAMSLAIGCSRGYISNIVNGTSSNSKFEVETFVE